VNIRLLKAHVILVFTMLGLMFPAMARAAPGDVQTVWRLLDYVAVDYSGAVSNGQITSEAEYAEMTEFSAAVRLRIAALPKTGAQQALVGQATGLQRAIAAKSSPETVAKNARSLATALLVAYPVSPAPIKAPDFTRGARLYQENCAACHGATGNGRGPSAAGLDPAPIAFADISRARQRSLFALYQVISQGLDGTSMQAFSQLSSEDRWALANYSGSIAFTDSRVGEKLWKNDPSVRKAIPDLTTLATITPATLGAAIGQDKADAVMAYLRAHPEVVVSASTGSLALTREKLRQSLAAYRAGDRKGAEGLALSAYLDGFEPVEPMLASRDAALMARIERAMGGLRSGISKGIPVSEIAAQVDALDELFGEAETAISPNSASDASTFIGALTILLREGLEALLIVVAMIAFLRKADRADVLPYVHGGWVSALLAGVATWIAATFVIGISGASRELTEGFGSLLAAVILLSVGIWMHGKSQADEWQRYIRATLGKALTRGSAWFLFGLAFLAVYREVFETIIFYAALSTQGNGAVMFAGAATAIALLGVIAWAMLRYSRRLPITKFFAYSSLLMAILAVVLIGKGVAALQEAGLVNVNPLDGFPRIASLGVFPATEPLLAQAVMLALLVMGFWHNTRRSPLGSGRAAT
jgi:high-affinity iron transporter